MEASAAPPDAQASVEGAASEALGPQQSCPATAALPAPASSEAPKLPKAGPNLVIPKNKLSGALVPVSTRTTSKWEPIEPKKENPEQQPPPPSSRKTKWGPDLTHDPAVKRGRALALQTRAEQLAAQLESGNLEIDNNEATRSPSPPPLYDALGHRMNTREARKREQLDIERREAIGECIKLNPSYKPPSGYRPVPKEAKLFIPAVENPGYNFIGLILGPRGNTQKRMEAETGARITIRGKGAVKEGKLPIKYGKDMDGSHEELHVHISADTYEKVDAAVAIIGPLLTPVDEQRNVHKMKQLRELAEMNGTVRLLFCNLCGEMGHKEFQCPKDKLQTFQAKVSCRLCGDGGHPTIDCPLKSTVEGKMMDKEYLNFLQELGGIESSGISGTDNPLTASGALPMPTGGTGANIEGGFPRFPFPIPPGPNGMNALNFILPRFFHPAFEIFRGRPIPPAGLRMMARMLSDLMERFPFPPPFGWRPDIGPPTSTTVTEDSTSLPADASMMVDRTQASGLVHGNALHNNAELFSCGFPTTNVPEKEEHDLPVSPSVGSDAVAPLSSSSVPFSSAMDPSHLCVVPQTAEGSSSSSVIPATSVCLAQPTLSPMETLPMPTGLPHPSTPFVGNIPVRPVIPSFRPAFPQSMQQSPGFMHLGGLGQSTVSSVSFDGSSSSSSTFNNSNFAQPLLPWTGTTNRGQAQHCQLVASSQVTSEVENSSSGYTYEQTCTTMNLSSAVLSNPLRPWSNLPSAGPGMIPIPQSSVVPAQYQACIFSSAQSPVLPSFIPVAPQTTQGQFTICNDDKLTSSSKNYGFPPPPGPNIMMQNTIPPFSFSPVSSLRPAANKMDFSYQIQAASPASQLPVGPVCQYGSSFSASEFSYVRPPVIPHPVSSVMPRNFMPPLISPPLISLPTVFSEQGLRQPPIFSTRPFSGSSQ